MTALFFCLLFIVLAFLCAKLEKKVRVWQHKKEEKKRREEVYKRHLLSSLDAVKDAVTPEPEEEEASDVDKLLKANREILNKKDVRRAMKDELGIE